MYLLWEFESLTLINENLCLTPVHDRSNLHVRNSNLPVFNVRSGGGGGGGVDPRTHDTLTSRKTNRITHKI